MRLPDTIVYNVAGRACAGGSRRISEQSLGLLGFTVLGLRVVGCRDYGFRFRLEALGRIAMRLCRHFVAFRNGFYPAQRLPREIYFLESPKPQVYKPGEHPQNSTASEARKNLATRKACVKPKPKPNKSLKLLYNLKRTSNPETPLPRNEDTGLQTTVRGVLY